jgi:flagellar biosynthesis/type III secretory pathway M-ring protein FliF/YscJ
MALNDMMREHSHPAYKKVLIISGVLLLVIIAGVLLWYFQKNKIPDQKTLTESEKESIVLELNKIAEDAPLTDAERYQLVTGRTSTPASVTATTTEIVKSSQTPKPSQAPSKK